MMRIAELVLGHFVLQHAGVNLFVEGNAPVEASDDVEKLETFFSTAVVPGFCGKTYREVIGKFPEPRQVVGGAVRDVLQNKTPKDIDMALSFDTVDELKKFMAENNMEPVNDDAGETFTDPQPDHIYMNFKEKGCEFDPKDEPFEADTRLSEKTYYPENDVNGLRFDLDSKEIKHHGSITTGVANLHNGLFQLPPNLIKWAENGVLTPARIFKMFNKGFSFVRGEKERFTTWWNDMETSHVRTKLLEQEKRWDAPHTDTLDTKWCISIRDIGFKVFCDHRHELPCLKDFHDENLKQSCGSKPCCQDLKSCDVGHGIKAHNPILQMMV